MLDQTVRDRPSDDSHGRAGIELLPFGKLESGDWSVLDVDLKALWARMEAEGTLSSVFLRGEQSTPEKFIEYLKHPGNLPVFAVSYGIVGVAWINCIEGNHAFGHFWFAKSIWGQTALETARRVIDYWFSFPKPDGSPLFEVILGKTSAKNRRAVKFVQRIGFESLGVIPKIYHGDDAVISFMTREKYYGR